MLHPVLAGIELGDLEVRTEELQVDLTEEPLGEGGQGKVLCGRLRGKEVRMPAWNSPMCCSCLIAACSLQRRCPHMQASWGVHGHRRGCIACTHACLPACCSSNHLQPISPCSQ